MLKSWSANSANRDWALVVDRLRVSHQAAVSVRIGSTRRTDFNVRDTTHFGWLRHAAAKSCSSAPNASREGRVSRTPRFPLSVLLDSSHTIPRLREPDEHLRVVSRDDQSRVGRELLHPVLRSQV